MPPSQAPPEDPLAGLASLADQARAPDQQPLREDFGKFFEALFRDAKGRPIKLQPFQLDIIRALMTKSRVLINLFRGGGKALALDTPVPTPAGWSTIGEIEVGDWVFGEDGFSVRVVAVSEVMHDRPCYSVELSGRERIVADAEHLWKTKCRVDGSRSGGYGRRVAVRTTQQIRDTLEIPYCSTSGYPERNHRIPACSALEMPEARLPVDPYVLGVWLGDGNSASSGLTCYDEEILQAVQEKERVVASSVAGRYYLGSRPDRLGSQQATLQGRLRSLGVLGDKHIPRAYLRADKTQRLALLQGLMDTDGGCDERGHCEFTSTNKRLAEGAFELISSLGLIPTLQEGRAKLQGRDCGPKYRVYFLPHAVPVFRLSRKLDRQRSSQRRRERIITAVDQVASVPVRCIQVDSPSGMFLVGRSMVPTHNSSLVTVAYVCWRVGNNRDIRIIIGCKNESLAKDFLRRVTAVMKSDEYIKVFGDLVPPERTGTWADTEKIVQSRSAHAQGLTILGIGAGAAVAGRRADLAIVDDCADAKNSSTAIQRGHLSTWLFEELEPVLEPEAQAIIVGTRWAHQDIYSEVQASWQARFQDDFTYILLPVLEKDDEGEWHSVWEERFPTKKMLTWWSNRPLEFAQQMMNNPVDSSLAFLQREWLDQNLYLRNNFPEALTIYFGVDPSWSMKTTADYSVICVGGKEPDTGMVYLLDMIRERCDPERLWQMVIGNATILRPAVINMEATAAQSFLTKKLLEETALNIQPIKTVNSKTERFTNMSSYFTTRRVRIAAEQIDGVLVPIAAFDPLYYEWSTFRGDKTTEHDDCLDALDLMLQAAAYGAPPIELSLAAAVPVHQQSLIATACVSCGEASGNLYRRPEGFLCTSCTVKQRAEDPRGFAYERLRRMMIYR